MKIPRLPRRRLVRLLLLATTAPILLWGLVLAVVPTEWARARLVGELEGLTGGKVSIESICLGPMGNLRIRGASVAEAATPGDPWLRVGEARLDVHLLQVLSGCCRPADVALDGVDVRVHRRADGSLEFAHLLERTDGDAGRERAGGSTGRRSSVTLAIADAHILVIDDPSSTRLDLSRAAGRATWDGARAAVQTLRGRLNGGAFEFAANYDRSGPAPSFEAELRAEKVQLGVGMDALGLLVPIVSDAADSLNARVDLGLALKGEGDGAASLRPTIRGYGSIRVDPIDLSTSRLLEAVEELRIVPRAARVGSVESHFAIGAGRVVTDDLTVTVARLPLVFVGWADFDGRIDYRVKSGSIQERLDARLPDEAREILGGLKQEIGSLGSLRITGTVDYPRVTTEGLAPGLSGRFQDEERRRIRDAAKKLRDKYLR